jgi:hexosaminidase
MYTYSTLIIIIFAAFTISCLPQQIQKRISVIPKPERIKIYEGDFKVTKNTFILNNTGTEECSRICSYLAESINKLTGIKPDFSDDKLNTNENKIVLSLDSDADSLGKEGYILEIKNGIAELTAYAPNGLFYAVQTILQLIPTNELRANNGENTECLIPCLYIKDAPRFKWRGMHLDTGRHFFSKENIKKYIDFMAMYKLNTFHMHLTEDQGWRIEIKKYPKLTEVGSNRKETVGDGVPYGGYYTQDDIKEIVEYAKSRYITIVPEIEMPGHAVAALASYPELSCTGGPLDVETKWGVFKDVFCAGNEKTFQFLEDVLTEVIALFPSEYIHIGGDECPKDRWHECPKCQKRIKDEGLKDEHELQSYFIHRIEKFLNSKGKRVIGWDEILEGGLAPNATVMSWRGEEGGITAAKQKHDVIMTPNTYLYFNYFQGNPEFEPDPVGRYLPLSKVYSYDPIPQQLTTDEQKYIIGTEACLWSENIPTIERIEYQIFPRLAALAEIAWTKRELRNWEDFTQRIADHLARYKFFDIEYSPSIYEVSAKSQFLNNNAGLKIELGTEINSSKIYYTTDGSNPTIESMLYSGPIELSSTTRIRAAAMERGELINRISDNTFYIHKALGKDVAFRYPFESKYSTSKYGLTDGVKGSTSYGDGKWKGFLVNDLEAVIDMDSLSYINRISCGFLNNTDAYIFLPKYVEFFISDDGTNYELLEKIDVNKDSSDNNTERKEVLTIVGKRTRFIKIMAKNIGYCPIWHKAAGEKAWLFADEIVVE